MEIKIEDYLDDNEIKDIIIYEFRESLKKHFTYEREIERILTNLSYNIVWSMVDKHFKYNASELIRNKVIDLINDLSEFSVFRQKDAWGKEDSIAYNELQKAMNNNKDLIQKKVKDVINNYDYSSALTKNSDWFTEVIVDALRKGLNE